MKRLFLSVILGLSLFAQSVFAAVPTPPEIIARSSLKGVSQTGGTTNQNRFLPMLNSNGVLDLSFLPSLVFLDSNGVSQAQFITATNDLRLYTDAQIASNTVAWMSATNALQTSIFGSLVRIGVLESQTQTWNSISLIPSMTNTMAQLVLYTNANNARVATIATSNATTYTILGTLTGKTNQWNISASTNQLDAATNSAVSASRSFTLATSNALYTVFLQSNSLVWAYLSTISTNGGSVTYATLTNTLAPGFTVTNFTVRSLLSSDSIAANSLTVPVIGTSNITLTGFLYGPATTATFGSIVVSDGTIGANPATMTQLWGATGAIWTSFINYTGTIVSASDSITNVGTGLIKAGKIAYVDWPLVKATNEVFFSTLVQYAGVTNNYVGVTNRIRILEGQTNLIHTLTNQYVGVTNRLKTVEGFTNAAATALQPLSTNHFPTYSWVSNYFSSNFLTGVSMSRVISVGGNMSFGSIYTGRTDAASLTIANGGNFALTVSNISYPSGFSGAWSGTIPPLSSTNLLVVFSPTLLQSYSGTITVLSDATAGLNSIAASGQGNSDYFSAGGSDTNASVLVTWSANNSPTPYTAPFLAKDASVSFGHVLAVLDASGGYILDRTTGGGEIGLSTIPSSLSSDVIRVVSGDNHALAVKSNHSLVAWGTVAGIETNMPSGTNVFMAAAGREFSLILDNDGTVTHLGVYSNLLPSLVGVVSIGAGVSHGLAVKSDGSLTAWGDNTYGQTNVPVGLPPVRLAAGGITHSVVLLTNGTVMAWGDNTYGQTNVPAGLTNIVDIAVGYFHTIALRDDGTLIPFGGDVPGWATPVIPSMATNVMAISAGGYQFAALLAPSGGVARTKWPLTQTFLAARQAYVGAVVIPPSPTNTPGEIVVSGDIGLYVLGANGYAEVSPHAPPDNFHPWPIAFYTNGVTTALQLDSNAWAQVDIDPYEGSRVYAIDMLGRLFASGYNVSGGLGIGIAFPLWVNHFEQIPGTWKHVATGVGSGQYTLGIKTDGSLWGWGYAGAAQGVGAMGTALYNVSLTNGLYGNLTTPTLIDAGVWETTGHGRFYIKGDKSLWALGPVNAFTAYSPQGNGLFPTLTKVDPNDHWVKVVTSSSGIYGLDTNGVVWSIGGNPPPTHVDFVKLTNNITFIDIDCHSSRSVLLVDSLHRLWGVEDNQKAQLLPLVYSNNLWNTSLYYATLIDTNQIWQSVYSGDYTSYAIQTNGTLWGRGKAQHGLLGSATNTAFYSPPFQTGERWATNWIQIGTASNWQSVVSICGSVAQPGSTNSYTIGIRR